jgi:hypothetical protein
MKNCKAKRLQKMETGGGQYHRNVITCQNQVVNIVGMTATHTIGGWSASQE